LKVFETMHVIRLKGSFASAKQGCGPLDEAIGFECEEDTYAGFSDFRQ
jgi:hypothetical protein